MFLSCQVEMADRIREYNDHKQNEDLGMPLSKRMKIEHKKKKPENVVNLL